MGDGSRVKGGDIIVTSLAGSSGSEPEMSANSGSNVGTPITSNNLKGEFTTSACCGMQHNTEGFCMNIGTS